MTRFKHILLGRNPKRTLFRASALVLITFVLFAFVVRPVRLQGISMEPTLHDGRIGLVSLMHYKRALPKRGDIVAVTMPGGRAFYVKRILGLPGETIRFANGQLVIDEEELKEPYIAVLGDWNMNPLVIPESHYFVAGDNRSTFFEGHTLGIVNKDQLAGVLLK